MVFSCIIKEIKGDLEQQCYNEACGQRLRSYLTWKCQTVVDLQNELFLFPLISFFFFPYSLLSSPAPLCPSGMGLSLWGFHSGNYFPHQDKSSRSCGY